MNLHKDEKIFILLLVFIFCITAVFYYYSFGLNNYQLITNLIFLVHPFLAVLGGIAATKAFGVKNSHGKSFLFITLGILCLFIGEVLYAYFLLVLKIEPFPSFADVFYLAAYPLLLTGIFREVLYYQQIVKASSNLILTLFTVFASLIVFSITVVPVIANNEPVLNKIISATYGIADIFLIVGCAYILMMIINIRGGRLFRAWLYILFGAIFMLLGDIFFAYYSGSYVQNIPQFQQIDLLWVIAYLSFTLGLSEMRFIIHDIQYKLKQLME